MELLPRIEIYSAVPYSGGEDSNIDDWFHVARNEKGEHIEAVWDIETLFRPEIPLTEKPGELTRELFFDEIRLHYALNYTSQRYHEDLMLWAIKALKPGGKLQIIAPDADWLLRYWVAEAVSLKNPDDYEVLPRDLVRENEELRTQLAKLQQKQKSWPRQLNPFKRIINDSGIPDNVLLSIQHKDMATEIPDRIIVDRPQEADFDIWIMQQLYSSGAGEPQDCFKSIFGKRYLSYLLSRTRFIVMLLQNNPQNPKQIEVKAYRHPSRLL